MKMKRIVSAILILVLNFSLSCPAFAASDVKVTGIYFNFNKTDGVGYMNNPSQVISVSLRPANATNKTFHVWTTDSTIIELKDTTLTADENGKATVEFYPRKVGTTELWVTTEDGGYADSRTIHIAPAERFDLTEDAWPVLNTYEAFSYPSNYKFPRERFEEVYGKSSQDFSAYYSDHGNDTWVGNCYGMGLSAILNYLGKIDLPISGTLNEAGFDGVKEYGGFSNESFLYLEKNSELTKIIERYSIAQHSSEHLAFFANSSMKVDLFQLRDAALCGETPVFINISYRNKNLLGNTQSGGHILVLDCADPTKVKFEDDGWYGLPVYDPNMPYYKNDENYQLSDLYDDSQERYFYVNPEKGQWKYNGSMTSSSSSQWHGTEYDDSSAYWGIRFDQIADANLSSNYLSLASSTKWLTMDIPTKAEEIVIKDKNTKQILFNSLHGSIKAVKDGWIITMPVGAEAAQDDGESASPSMYMLSGPVGNYEVTFKNGSAAIRGQDNINIVETDGTVTFDLNAANDSIALTAQSTGSVSVFQENVFDRDIYTTAKLSGQMTSGQTLHTSLNDEDQFSVSASDGLTMDLEVSGNTSEKDYVVQDQVLGAQQTSDLQEILTGTPGSETTPSVTFSDIDGHWAESYILDMAKKGILNGTGQGKFSPNMQLSRGMFLTALYRLAGKPAVEQAASFTDVKDTDYFADAAAWGEAKGITSGSGDKKLLPNKSVSREEMATMLYRYLKTIQQPQGGTLTAFADASSISPWATEAAATCSALGLITGRPQANQLLFAPQAGASRAEACTILYRLDGLVQ